MTAGKKPDKIGLSEFPAPCQSNVSPSSCGYVHSAETGLYYLQSRYYNPKIGRFLNADALVSTGQGVLGNNMFAYCLNDPVSSSDDSGYLTDGQIHDAVLEEISKRSGYRYKYKRADTKIIYLGKYGMIHIGFCDLYDPDTGETWELKKNTGSTTCRTEYAKMQLSNYVNGLLVADLTLDLKYPESTILSGFFTLYDTSGTKYIINYWDQGGGILRYQYYAVPSEFGMACAVVIAGVFVASLMPNGGSSKYNYHCLRDE